MSEQKDKKPKELCLACKIVILTVFVLIFTGSDLWVKQIAYDNLRDKRGGIDVVEIGNFGWKHYYATNYDIGFGILGKLDEYLSTPGKLKTEVFEDNILAKLDEGSKAFLLEQYKIDDIGRNYVLKDGLSKDVKEEITYILRRAEYRTAKWIFLVALQGLGTLLVMGFFFYTVDKKQAFPLALIISGALGNVLDRAMRGFVVDYVMWYYKGFVWPIFNLADVYTVIGAILLFIIIMFFTKEEKKELKAK